MAAKVYEALHEFQKDVPALQRDAVNPHFGNSYISLETLLAEVLPLLNKHGLVLVQLPSLVDGTPALTTQLIHVEDGSVVESTMPLILDKENSQGLGSAITYGRRYGLQSVLAISAEVDDDGEAASRSYEKKETSRTKF